MTDEWSLSPLVRDGESLSARRLRLKIFHSAAGQFIASARQDRNLTQVAVARALGRPSSAVSRLEAGENGFKGGFAERVLDYLESQSVEVPGSDRRSLRARLREEMQQVEMEIGRDFSEEDLRATLLKYQRRRSRGITYADSLAMQEYHDPSLALALAPRTSTQDAQGLRESIESTRHALDPLLHRAHNLSNVEARLYLTQLRSLLAALSNVDPAVLGEFEMSISRYASEAKR